MKIIFLTILFYAISYSQSNINSVARENITHANKIYSFSVFDSLKIALEKVKPDVSFGFLAGYSSQLSASRIPDSGRGIFLEINLSGKISDSFNWLLAFNYIEGQTKSIGNSNYLYPSKLHKNKELKLEIDMLLFNIPYVSFLFGQSFSVGNNTQAVNSVFSIGESLKLRIPIYNNGVRLSASGTYQKGGELLNFGGGIAYALFIASIGVEINLNQ